MDGRSLCVGDTVRIRDWDDMVYDYGVDCDGDINTPSGYFWGGCRGLCGKEFVITRIWQDNDEDAVHVEGFGAEDDCDISSDMIVLVEAFDDAPDIDTSNIDEYLDLYK